MRIDPRMAIIGKRLRGARRIIAVSGSKGGIGKSSVASLLALTLGRLGYRAGLLDLDFTSPSTHFILGVEGLLPKEDKGIIPPSVHGIKYLSITFYSGDRPLPLRGGDVSNAMIELLTITRWGGLDFLVVDMPPGLGDTTLDAIRLFPRVEFLLITNPSRLVAEAVRRAAVMLQELKIPILGVVENMKRDEAQDAKQLQALLHVPYLGAIRYDDRFEEALGNAQRLVESDFGRDLERIVLQAEAFAAPRRGRGRSGTIAATRGIVGGANFSAGEMPASS
ncbi:MAG: ATP-binding protein [Candidatus Oleimicrobiaceae bacterium]